MGIFSRIFGEKKKKVSDNDLKISKESKARISQIGGIKVGVLDFIKLHYSPNDRYTSKVSAYSVNIDNVLDHLRNGLNPNYVTNTVPLFLKVQDINVLRILEYFGADTHFKSRSLKNVNIGWMNDSLIDYFKDIIPSVDKERLTWTYDLKMIIKYKEFGMSFKPDKKVYSRWDNGFIWRVLLKDKEDHVRNYILTRTDFSFYDEIEIGSGSDRKNSFVWYHYLSYYVIGKDRKNAKKYEQFFLLFNNYIDYRKTTKDNFWVFDVVEIEDLEPENKRQIKSIFKKYGMDYEEYINDVVLRRRNDAALAESKKIQKAQTVRETEPLKTIEELELLDLEKDSLITITQAEIDELKQTYQSDPDFHADLRTLTYSEEYYIALPRHKIISLLKSGMDPNKMYKIYNLNNNAYAPFMQALNVDDLKVLEQFGADIYFKSEKSAKLTGYQYINFPLYDFYQDQVLKTKLYYVSRFGDKRRLVWLKDHGYNFKIRSSYRNVSDVPIWRPIVKYSSVHEQYLLPDVRDYILEEIKPDLTMEVAIGPRNQKVKLLYWWLLIISESLWIFNDDDIESRLGYVAVVLRDFKDKLDLNAKSSDGSTIVDAANLCSNSVRDALLIIFKDHGIDIGESVPKDSTKLGVLTTSRFDNVETIGGYSKSDLDVLKELPSNTSFNYYNCVLTPEDFMEKVKLGFNPIDLYNGFPVFLKAPSQNAFDVFEYLGAPVNEDLKNHRIDDILYVSDYMLRKNIKTFLEYDPKIFRFVTNVDTLKFLRAKGLDFNSVNMMSSQGWFCFTTLDNNGNYNRHGKYSSEEFIEARRYIVGEGGLDLSLKIHNDSASADDKIPTWYLFGSKLLGIGLHNNKGDMLKNYQNFEMFINEYSSKISIYDTSTKRNSFYFMFCDCNASYLQLLLPYLMYQFGLNPYFKNSDNVSFIDILEKKKRRPSKLIELLDSSPNIERFKNSTHLVKIDDYDKFSDNLSKNTTVKEFKIKKEKIMNPILPDTGKTYHFHYEEMLIDHDADIEITLTAANGEEPDLLEFRLRSEEAIIEGSGTSEILTWYSEDEFSFKWDDVTPTIGYDWIGFGVDSYSLLESCKYISRLPIGDNDTLDDLKKLCNGTVEPAILAEFNAYKKDVEYFSHWVEIAEQWFEENELRFKYDAEDDSLSLFDPNTEEWIEESE